MGKKIATCNYCGTRAVLVFDAARHELTCSACGAPLHDMKFMPQEPGKEKKKSVKPQASKYSASATMAGGSGKSSWAMTERKPRKKKKKKTFFKRVLEDIIDEIEDIFD